MLHTGAVVTYEEEGRFLVERPAAERLPYGVALWPSAIALAHELASRADELRGASLLELGAGTGLPGIVAASFGARVVQVDRNELALHVCRRNAERNGVTSIEHRLADWTAWEDTSRYRLIVGSDVLYASRMHPFLQRILETNLERGGRVLLADPFRPASLALLEGLEAAGWAVAMSKWTVAGGEAPRPVGVYELAPPG